MLPDRQNDSAFFKRTTVDIFEPLAFVTYFEDDLWK